MISATDLAICLAERPAISTCYTCHVSPDLAVLSHVTCLTLEECSAAPRGENAVHHVLCSTAAEAYSATLSLAAIVQSQPKSQMAPAAAVSVEIIFSPNSSWKRVMMPQGRRSF